MTLAYFKLSVNYPAHSGLNSETLTNSDHLAKTTVCSSTAASLSQMLTLYIQTINLSFLLPRELRLNQRLNF